MPAEAADLTAFWPIALPPYVTGVTPARGAAAKGGRGP
jgi:hypothetical protein